MNNQMQIFKSKEFGKVRVIEKNGQPWFIGKDVAEILGYEAERNAIKHHVDSDDKLTHQISASGQNRKMIIINESGLYSLILSSKLPTAKAFKRWVTSEVLPSIRKHGSYINGETLEKLLSNPDLAMKYFAMLKAEREQKEALEGYIEGIKPKVQYYDIILQCDSAIPISVIAKDYGITAVAFNRILNDFEVQYKVGKTWVLYKDHCNNGYTISKTYHVNETTAVIHTYWTQKGRQFIYELLKWYGILPQVERKGAESCRT